MRILSWPKNPLRIALLSVLLLCVSCAPPWAIVRQSTPNQFAGQREFILERIDFGELQLEADHGPAIERAFEQALRGQAGTLQLLPDNAKGHPRIRMIVTRVEKGISMGTTSTNSEIDARVQLIDEEQVLDEILLQVTSNQDDEPTMGGIPLGGYSDTDRLQSAARRLGRQLARYLKKRTK